jgi:hypothetical protein
VKVSLGSSGGGEGDEEEKKKGKEGKKRNKPRLVEVRIQVDGTEEEKGGYCSSDY